MTFPLIELPRWNAMEPKERLQTLLGMTLDRCYQWLAHEPGALNPTQMNMQIQVMRAVLHTVTKLGIEDRRLESQRQNLLDEMTAALDAAERERS